MMSGLSSTGETWKNWGEMMNTLVDRMIRAARLEVNLYEEVEADRSTLAQAMTVVVLSSLAAGVGGIGTMGLGGIVVGTLLALGGWYFWAFLTYWIGTRMLPEPQTSADLGELLRTTGFSSSPGLLRILGVIPGVGGLVFVVAAIWMLVAMVIAVRQALDYQSTLRAVGVCLIGWLIQGLLLAMMFAFTGGLATGI
jgi:hypothetical protein